MRRAVLAAGGLLLFAALFFASFIVVGETGEVVVLHSRTDSGDLQQTRLWVVDYEGRQWLRSGSSERGWAQRVIASPEVELDRSGEHRSFRAVLVATPEARKRLDSLMREKYGLADWWATALRPNEPVPLRLDPSESP